MSEHLYAKDSMDVDLLSLYVCPSLGANSKWLGLELIFAMSPFYC